MEEAEPKPAAAAAAAAAEAKRAADALPPPLPPRLAPWRDFATVFTNPKAGMDAADAERIKQVVYEASVGSAFHTNEQRKTEAGDARTKETLARLSRLAPAELARRASLAGARLSALEASRDLSRAWLVVDMDAFYAACEEQKDPALKSVPMAVGGVGMICTASYAARAFGVRSAMPGFIALKLCPELVFVRPDFPSYQKASALARGAMAAFDARLDMASLDEAYLDVTAFVEREREASRAAGGAAVARGPPTFAEVSSVAERVRNAVREATGGLTCSVGAAPNRTLAKICADLRKPDGQFVLPSFPGAPTAAPGGGGGGGGGDGGDGRGSDHAEDDDEGPASAAARAHASDGSDPPPPPSAEAVRAFVSSLPLRKVPGVGRVTERALSALAVRVCADVIERRAELSAVCSPSLLEFLFSAALGLGPTRHAPPTPPGEVRRKGIGCERTFSGARSAARGELEPELEALAASMAADMAEEGLEARTLTLKLKLSRTFELRTRTATLDGGRHARTAEQMLPALRRLLRAEGRDLELRLMGVRASGLRATRERRRQELEEAGGEAAAGGPIERMLGGGAKRQRLQEEGAGGGGSPPALGGGAAAAAAAAPAAVAAAAAAAAPPPAPASFSCLRWSCGACTLVNPSLSLRCEACGERRGGAFSSAVTAAAGGAAAASAAAAAAAAARASATAADPPPAQEEEQLSDDSNPLALLMRGEGDGDDADDDEGAISDGPADDGDDGRRGGGGTAGGGAGGGGGGPREDAGTPGLTPGLTPSGRAAQFRCDQCGVRLDARDAQEHRDYHLAEALQREEEEEEQRGGAAGAAGAAEAAAAARQREREREQQPGGRGGKRGKPNSSQQQQQRRAKNIDSYFTPRSVAPPKQRE